MALLLRALLIVCLLGDAAASAWAAVAHDRAHTSAHAAASAPPPCHETGTGATHHPQPPADTDCCGADRCDCGCLHVTAALQSVAGVAPAAHAPNPDDARTPVLVSVVRRPPLPPPIG